MFPYSAVNSSEISYDKEEETVTLSFPSPLPLGNGQLIMDFTGELNDKMKGFYRSKYTGTDGKEKYCAVTQFEVCTIYVLFDLNIIYTFNYYFNVAKCNLGKVRIKPMLVCCIFAAGMHFQDPQWGHRMLAVPTVCRLAVISLALSPSLAVHFCYLG